MILLLQCLASFQPVYFSTAWADDIHRNWRELLTCCPDLQDAVTQMLLPGDSTLLSHERNPNGIGLVLLSYHSHRNNITGFVLQWHSANLPVILNGQETRKAEAWRYAENFLTLLASRDGTTGAVENATTRARAWDAALTGDLTFVREETVEPLEICVLIPDATAYLPRSIACRIRESIFRGTVTSTEWRGQFLLTSADEQGAEQAANILASWQEMATSFTDGRQVSTLPGRLHEALKNVTIEVNAQHVVIALNLPAAAVAQLAQRVSSYLQSRSSTDLVTHASVQLPVAAASTNDLRQLSRDLQSTNAAVRVQAITNLSRLPESQSIPHLLATLRDPDPSVRVLVINVLRMFSAKRVLPVLRGLLDDENEQVRAAAIWSLAELCDTGSKNIISSLARRDPSALVRFRSVWALAYVGDASDLPVVIAALGDGDTAVRERAAVVALSKLADTSTSVRLLQMVAHSHPSTRRLAAHLLCRYPSEVGRHALRRALKDENELVRAEAARSLGILRADEAVADLLPLLSEKDQHVRGSAAYAIGMMSDKTLAEKLRPLLDDPHAFVRAVVNESLQRWGDPAAKPPAGFRAVDVFCYPVGMAEPGKNQR